MNLKNIFKINKSRVIYLIVIFFGMYFFINLFFHNSFSFRILNDNQIVTYILILLFVLLTFFFSALSYYFLSFHQLSLIKSFIFQFSSNLFNKILPSGIGAIGMNFLYLKKYKSNTSEAAAVLFVNNLLGVFVTTFIFFSIILFNQGKYLKFIRLKLSYLLVIVAIILILFVIYKSTSLFKKLVNKFVGQFLKTLKLFTNRKRDLLLSLVSQLLISLFNSLALFLSIKAFGVNLSYLNTFIVYTIGVLFGTFIPLPGGLGGVELGLSTMLIVFRISAEVSLSIVLLFRLFNYWIPLLLGLPAFLYTRKNKLI